MKRKITWLVTSCLAILSLVVVSCAQAPSTIKATTIPTTQAAPTTATAAISTAKPVAAPAVEKPKYGGALKVGWSTDIIEFDDVVGIPYRSYTLQVTNESLWSGDWAKGPAGGYGSNESSWTDLTDVWEHKAGYLAESWEIPNKIEGEVGTIIYHIRKGVRWALNPQSEASRLVGGRELTADDVVFSLKQVITDPRAQLSTSNPEVRVAQITALDKWTVKVQIPWDAFEAAVSRFSDYVHIVPPEVVKKYGTMVDWKVSVGTGPFMLTEVVAASSLTLVRNPNYWMKDPIGPGRGNQLPYLDGVKFLIMTDWSTLLAALRTAKIDWAKGVSMEDAASLKKTAPQLLSKDMTGSKTGLAMRLDRVPFNDIRVRRAMMMAIDFEGINKNLYQGKAQIVTWPNTYQQEYAAAYLGLDDTEMPASVKELYTFNPEKAKALLKEAGYPTGFKTTATIFNTVAEIEYYSIYKDMWSKVGIDLKLEPKDNASHITVRRTKNFEGMVSGAGSGPNAMLYKLLNFYGPGLSNSSSVDDAYIKMKYAEMQRLATTDRAAADRLHKELMKYVLDQVWTIPSLAAPTYQMWWPWLKNYSGEVNVGYIHRHFLNWVWLDEAQKKSMGY